MRGVVFDEVSGDFPGDAIDVADLVAEPDAVELVRVLEQLGPEGGRDELRVVAQLVDHVGDGLAMLGVEGLVDFVEEIERGGIALLDGEDQRQRHERLLSAAELVHFSHLSVASGERDSDADASEVIGRRHFAALELAVVILRRSQHQVAGSVRHQLLEYLREVVRHLSECELNGFDLPHLEVVHEFSGNEVGDELFIQSAD